MSGHALVLGFEPLDTLFFRDGRPYTKGESEQVNVVSQFPPTPATLVGAVRAAVARSLGWNGSGSWSESIKEQLGDGENLAALRFRGPFLLLDGKPRFPAPANLMQNEKAEWALLSPGAERTCDLGEAVRLPTLPTNIQGEGWKQAGAIWLSLEDFARTLAGQAPANTSSIEQKEKNSLWSSEARVGIARNEITRTTEEGAMYSPQHIRLRQGVQLGIWLQGLDRKALDPITRRPQPVGGEARSAWITVADAKDVAFPAPPTLQSRGDSLNYTVIVLSPLPLASPPAPEQPIDGLPGTLVSACLPRAIMIGGWDSVHHQPLALKPHLAPGSVLFMRARSAEKNTVLALHNTCIGIRRAWGYGWIAIGTWSNQ